MATRRQTAERRRFITRKPELEVPAFLPIMPPEAVSSISRDSRDRRSRRTTNCDVISQVTSSTASESVPISRPVAAWNGHGFDAGEREHASAFVRVKPKQVVSGSDVQQPVTASCWRRSADDLSIPNSISSSIGGHLVAPASVNLGDAGRQRVSRRTQGDAHEPTQLLWSPPAGRRQVSCDRVTGVDRERGRRQFAADGSRLPLQVAAASSRQTRMPLIKPPIKPVIMACTPDLLRSTCSGFRPIQRDSPDDSNSSSLGFESGSGYEQSKPKPSHQVSASKPVTELAKHGCENKQISTANSSNVDCSKPWRQQHQPEATSSRHTAAAGNNRASCASSAGSASSYDNVDQPPTPQKSVTSSSRRQTVPDSPVRSGSHRKPTKSSSAWNSSQPAAADQLPPTSSYPTRLPQKPAIGLPSGGGGAGGDEALRSIFSPKAANDSPDLTSLSHHRTLRAPNWTPDLAQTSSISQQAQELTSLTGRRDSIGTGNAIEAWRRQTGLTSGTGTISGFGGGLSRVVAPHMLGVYDPPPETMLRLKDVSVAEEKASTNSEFPAVVFDVPILPVEQNVASMSETVTSSTQLESCADVVVVTNKPVVRSPHQPRLVKPIGDPDVLPPRCHSDEKISQEESGESLQEEEETNASEEERKDFKTEEVDKSDGDEEVDATKSSEDSELSAEEVKPVASTGCVETDQTASSDSELASAPKEENNSEEEHEEPNVESEKTADDNETAVFADSSENSSSSETASADENKLVPFAQEIEQNWTEKSQQPAHGSTIDADEVTAKEEDDDEDDDDDDDDDDDECDDDEDSVNLHNSKEEILGLMSLNKIVAECTVGPTVAEKVVQLHDRLTAEPSTGVVHSKRLPGKLDNGVINRLIGGSKPEQSKATLEKTYSTEILLDDVTLEKTANVGIYSKPDDAPTSLKIEKPADNADAEEDKSTVTTPEAATKCTPNSNEADDHAKSTPDVVSNIPETYTKSHYVVGAPILSNSSMKLSGKAIGRLVERFNMGAAHNMTPSDQPFSAQSSALSALKSPPATSTSTAVSSIPRIVVKPLQSDRFKYPEVKVEAKDGVVLKFLMSKTTTENKSDGKQLTPSNSSVHTISADASDKQNSGSADISTSKTLQLETHIIAEENVETKLRDRLVAENQLKPITTVSNKSEDSKLPSTSTSDVVTSENSSKLITSVQSHQVQQQQQQQQQPASHLQQQQIGEDLKTSNLPIKYRRIQQFPIMRQVFVRPVGSSSQRHQECEGLPTVVFDVPIVPITEAAVEATMVKAVTSSPILKKSSDAVDCRPVVCGSNTTSGESIRIRQLPEDTCVTSSAATAAATTVEQQTLVYCKPLLTKIVAKPAAIADTAVPAAAATETEAGINEKTIPAILEQTTAGQQDDNQQISDVCSPNTPSTNEKTPLSSRDSRKQPPPALLPRTTSLSSSTVDSEVPSHPLSPSTPLSQSTLQVDPSTICVLARLSPCSRQTASSRVSSASVMQTGPNTSDVTSSVRNPERSPTSTVSTSTATLLLSSRPEVNPEAATRLSRIVTDRNAENASVVALSQRRPYSAAMTAGITQPSHDVKSIVHQKLLSTGAKSLVSEGSAVMAELDDALAVLTSVFTENNDVSITPRRLADKRLITSQSFESSSLPQTAKSSSFSSLRRNFDSPNCYENDDEPISSSTVLAPPDVVAGAHEGERRRREIEAVERRRKLWQESRYKPEEDSFNKKEADSSTPSSPIAGSGVTLFQLPVDSVILRHRRRATAHKSHKKRRFANSSSGGSIGHEQPKMAAGFPDHRDLGAHSSASSTTSDETDIDVSESRIPVASSSSCNKYPSSRRRTKANHSNEIRNSSVRYTMSSSQPVDRIKDHDVISVRTESQRRVEMESGKRSRWQPEDVESVIWDTSPLVRRHRQQQHQLPASQDQTASNRTGTVKGQLITSSTSNFRSRIDH